MIIDFFETLGDDPQDQLADVWDTILEETAAFNKVQEACVSSLMKVNWPGAVSHLDKLSCRECASSLIGQLDRDNTDSALTTGKCFQCGEEYYHEQIVEMVVGATYDFDTYLAAKNGESSPVATCPNCGVDTYVEDGEVQICFSCSETFGGQCDRCGESISIHDYNPDNPAFCSYCAHVWEKVIQE